MKSQHFNHKMLDELPTLIIQQIYSYLSNKQDIINFKNISKSISLFICRDPISRNKYTINKFNFTISQNQLQHYKTYENLISLLEIRDYSNLFDFKRKNFENIQGLFIRISDESIIRFNNRIDSIHPITRNRTYLVGFLDDHQEIIEKFQNVPNLLISRGFFFVECEFCTDHAYDYNYDEDEVLEIPKPKYFISKTNYNKKIDNTYHELLIRNTHDKKFFRECINFIYN